MSAPPKACVMLSEAKHLGRATASGLSRSFAALRMTGEGLFDRGIAMRRRRGRLGFTLIELLVVIGIIAVLIAILIPVVGRVRLAAQTANTTNQMHRISAAIQTYYHDFNAYPGALPNSAFA